MKAKVNRVSIELTQENLWSVPAAAKVNSTDTSLSLSPNLAALAGIDVQREIAAIGYCAVGAAVMTNAGNLSAEKLIHAVGPRWGEGSERGKLTNLIFECLRITEQNGLKSIALPAISTGAHGYPLEACAAVMLTQIVDYTFEDLKNLRKVIVCLDTPLAYEAFKRELEAQLAELRNAEV
jgi:O-acetyl-ADP-ribose deacetylase